MNRGIGQRTLFENEVDMRKFLSCLAREVRRGTIEVHCYCLMLNHFHFLIRSVDGQLSAAMRRIQNSYSRWFNRMRGRMGTLYQSRFRSYVVESLAYRRRVVSYIHDNPVAAGIVAHPVGYAWSSARAYGATTRPRWLSTGWVDDEIDRRGGDADDPRQRLLAAFPVRVDPDFREHLERQFATRVSRTRADEDATPHHVRSPRTVEWAIEQTALGDGTRPFQPPCRADATEDVLAEVKGQATRRPGRVGPRAQRTWLLLRVALLRICGFTLRVIGYRVGRDESSVCRDLQRHKRRMTRNPSYRAQAAELIASALARSRAA